MKILCLFVRHGTKSYPDALRVLDRWYEKQGLLDQRTLWILDNSLPGGTPLQDVAPGVQLRAGNNDAWEFSTWERALNEARKEQLNYDVVHFVTSAFNTLYTTYLDHFFPEMLNYVIERNVCLGHIDGYDRVVRVGDATSQSWIRTCFFFLPWTLAATLSPWVTYSDSSRLFASPDTRQFKEDAPIDENYQRTIALWLQGGEIGGHTWHTPVGQESGENSRFQHKTVAILNEHRLAVTVRRMGIRLTDFCWLHSFRTTPVPVISDPPVETAQIEIRRKILGFLKSASLPDRLGSC